MNQNWNQVNAITKNYQNWIAEKALDGARMMIKEIQLKWKTDPTATFIRAP